MDHHQSAQELLQRFREIGKIVIGIDDILVQAYLALLTKEHLLWVGEPGRAKSFTARMIFSMLSGAHVFKTQVTHDMLPSAIFGNPIPDEYMKTGREVICLDGGLAECHLALLEEFFDGNRSVIRSVLTAMNERRFESKDQSVNVPLHTAILTTNWKAEDKASEAVRDRMIFKACFPDLAGMTDHLRMYRAYLGYAGEIPEVTTFPFEQVVAMAQHVESPDGIPIPMPVRLVYAVLVERFQEERVKRAKERFIEEAGNDPQITDVNVKDLQVREVTPRTRNKLLDVVRASALISGRSQASYQDLVLTRFGLCVTNDGSGDDKLFEEVWKEVNPPTSSHKKLDLLGRVADKMVELQDNPPENLVDFAIDLGGKVETFTQSTLCEWLDKISGGTVVTEIANRLQSEIKVFRSGDPRGFDALP